MVPDSGATTRPDRLRPLSLPRPLRIAPRPGDGWPAILIERDRRRPVAHVQDRWRIDDEWWRDPISRHYYRVVLDDGAVRTLYHDTIADRWYEQAY